MTAPGWYPDPSNPGMQRWWDGSQWGPPAPIQAQMTPAPESLPTDAPPPEPAKNRTKLIAIVVAVVVVVGAGVGIAVAVGGGDTKHSFSTTGTMEVDGAARTVGDLDIDEADIIYKGTKCFTTGGYDDISKGTQVTVSDENGKTVGVGELSDGVYSEGACSFPFTIKDLPAGRKFYKVEVSHRGGIQYTEKQMRDGVAVSLGS